MSGLLDVDTALACITAGVAPLEAEAVPLQKAHGRVLAHHIKAQRDQPPFAASAMDGYAVRYADVAFLPSDLKVIGESAAGKRFDGICAEGEAVRIFTGGVMPEGADTVVIQEDCERTSHVVTVRESGTEGTYVRPVGYDFSAGETVVEAGKKLDAAALSLAAAANCPAPLCYRRPLVAIIATGNELVAVGGKPGADEIIASNSAGIAAIISAAGGEALDCGIAKDTLSSLDAAFERAAKADIIVTLGGASVGEHDLVRQALEARGAKMEFWALAMQPGKPVMFGHMHGKRVLGLPGNPVSGLVGTEVFVRPLIRAYIGQPATLELQKGRLGCDLKPGGKRRQFMRAVLENGTVTPMNIQDSSLLHIYAKANCLLVRPEHAAASKKGENCQYMLISA